MTYSFSFDVPSFRSSDVSTYPGVETRKIKITSDGSGGDWGGEWIPGHR